MNIFIITQNEPFYLPAFFSKVFERIKHEVVGVAVLSESTSKRRTLKKYFSFYGPWMFCVVLFQYMIIKMSDLLSSVFPIKNLHSIGRICHRYKLNIIEANDINSREFISKLKALKVDVVVSIASPQIFKRELIETPPLGCINIHGAPLPKYRGMMPSFWMLLNDEKKGAVTAHYIDAAVDNGDIILQREYDIDSGMTHHEHIIKSKAEAADLLIQALDLMRTNQVERKVNDASLATYYSFPKKDDLKRFFEMGKRLR